MVSYGSVMLYFLGYGNVMLYFLGYGLFHYFLMYLELVKIVMYHFLLLVQPRCYLLWVLGQKICLAVGHYQLKN